MNQLSWMCIEYPCTEFMKLNIFAIETYCIISINCLMASDNAHDDSIQIMVDFQFSKNVK